MTTAALTIDQKHLVQLRFLTVMSVMRSENPKRKLTELFLSSFAERDKVFLPVLLQKKLLAICSSSDRQNLPKKIKEAFTQFFGEFSTQSSPPVKMGTLPRQLVSFICDLALEKAKHACDWPLFTEIVEKAKKCGWAEENVQEIEAFEYQGLKFVMVPEKFYDDKEDALLEELFQITNSGTIALHSLSLPNCAVAVNAFRECSKIATKSLFFGAEDPLLKSIGILVTQALRNGRVLADLPDPDESRKRMEILSKIEQARLPTYFMGDFLAKMSIYLPLRELSIEATEKAHLSKDLESIATTLRCLIFLKREPSEEELAKLTYPHTVGEAAELFRHIAQFGLKKHADLFTQEEREAADAVLAGATCTQKEHQYFADLVLNKKATSCKCRNILDPTLNIPTDFVRVLIVPATDLRAVKNGIMLSLMKARVKDSTTESKAESKSS